MCVWSSTTSGTKGAGPAWCTKSNKNVQSSQQSSDRSCFCTNTRTTHTRQNTPYRLGVVPAGVVGARGRCCPPATVPVAVVCACGVCCQNKIIDRKTELCHHLSLTRATKSCLSALGTTQISSSPTKQSAQQRVREQHTQKLKGAGPAWCPKLQQKCAKLSLVIR